MSSEESTGQAAGSPKTMSPVRACGLAAACFVFLLAFALFAMPMLPEVRSYLMPAAKKAEMDIVSIDAAIANFIVVSGGRAPASLEALVTPDENGRTLLKNYTSIPVDPWGNRYRYEPPTGSRDYRVFTLGRDGKLGGEGNDADIDNFTIIADKSGLDSRGR